MAASTVREETSLGSERTQLFETLSIPKAVIKLSVPTILSSLVMVLYNLADTFFVGMLNDPVQNAAVTLAAPALLAFNAINNLFGVGSSSMMSRALGRRDIKTVERSSAFGFYSALFCGLLLSLLYTVSRSFMLGVLGAEGENLDATSDYLFWTTTLGAAPSILNVVMAYLVRAEGSALHASLGTMSGCILNIILDPLFIMPWGFNMKASGAGLATFISNCAACLYFFVLIAIRRGKTHVNISHKNFRPDREIVFGVCGVGIPAAIQNLLNVTGMTVLNNFVAGWGSDAISAMGIAHKLNMIPFQIAMGFSQGVMPLVSYNYASGNRKRMRKATLFAGSLSLSFLCLITVVYFGFSDGLVSLFMENESVVGYGARFLRGMCLALPFLCLDFLAVGVFQACGLGRLSLLFAILRKIILEIPALYVLNYLFPLYGLAYAQLFAEAVLGVSVLVVLGKLLKKSA